MRIPETPRLTSNFGPAAAAPVRPDLVKKRVPKVAAGQKVLEFPSGRVGTPEATAKRAVVRMPTTITGHRVKMTPTLFLPHDVAEYIVARAIREGKNTAGVVAEILSAEARRRERRRRHRGSNLRVESAAPARGSGKLDVLPEPRCHAGRSRCAGGQDGRAG